MRPNFANLLIAVTLSALIGYGFWAASDDLRSYVGIGSFAYLAGTLCPAMGFQYEYERTSVNLRIVCGTFFAIGLAINLGFALAGSSQTAYILASAITFLVYLFLANLVYGSNQ